MEKKTHDDDDDSENDSDYDPMKDGDMEEDNEEGKQQNSLLQPLSFSRKRKVEDLWQTLQNDEEKLKEKYKQSMIFQPTTTKSTKTNKSLKLKRKNQKILESIFGKTVASQMSSKIQDNNENQIQNAVNIKETIAESIKKVQRKSKVVEIRKFAGQEIE